MVNSMKAYTVAFESNNGEQISTRDIVSFLEKIESILSSNPENVIRRINGKIMRVHAFEWSQKNHDYLVVPLGKLKEKNKPYGSDPNTQKLVDIPQEMFDVNSFAYHKRYNVALVSTNQEGPHDNDIEDYFNSYLPANDEFKIRLVPIMRNISLDKIRNAQEVRSIIISLNLGRPLNDFLTAQKREDISIMQHFKALMDYSKGTLESNTFTLKFGLGGKKKSSIEIGALMDLLQSINLDSNCISEITVTYRNRPEEKIDIAKLKKCSSILKVDFSIVGTRLGSEYIINNMDEVLRKEREKYYAHVQTHFQDVVDIGEEYEIEEIWDERPMV